jgi:xanthine/CO dehydrogenase XdhC/CoxF family maturation factor
MLHADIKHKAEELTGVSAYAAQIPEGKPLPAIAYMVNFDTSEVAQSNISGPTKVTATFDIMAHTFDSLETVASALRNGFVNFGGLMGAVTSPDTRTHVLKLTRLTADETAREIYEVNGQRAFMRTMSFSLTHR